MKNIALVVMAIILVLGGAILLPESTRAQSTPQGWEYKTVVIENVLFGPFGTVYDEQNDRRRILGDTTFLVEDGSQAVTDYLNELGTQGWELVSYGHAHGEIGGHFVFKRPLQ